MYLLDFHVFTKGWTWRQQIIHVLTYYSKILLSFQDLSTLLELSIIVWRNIVHAVQSCKCINVCRNVECGSGYRCSGTCITKLHHFGQAFLSLSSLGVSIKMNLLLFSPALLMLLLVRLGTLKTIWHLTICAAPQVQHTILIWTFIV